MRILFWGLGLPLRKMPNDQGTLYVKLMAMSATGNLMGQFGATPYTANHVMQKSK